jgi:hypothetical protein
MLEKTKGIIKNGQSKDIGNFGHARHRTKTHKQTGIQDTERRQTNWHQDTERRQTNKKHRSNPVNVLFVIQDKIYVKGEKIH